MKEYDLALFNSLPPFDLDDSDDGFEAEDKHVQTNLNHNVFVETCSMVIPSNCAKIRLIKDFLEYELGYS